MNKAKKLALFIVLTLSFFFVFQDVSSAASQKSQKPFTNSYGIKMTQEEYGNLKELGFTDLAIDQMSMETFLENKDLVIDSKSEVTKYYEIIEKKPVKTQLYSITIEDLNNIDDEDVIYTTNELTEEEYFTKVNKKKSGIQALSASDETRTSYRRLTTSVYNISGNIRVHSKFVWDLMPSTRSYDVLSTSIDSTFTPQSGSEFGQQLWSLTNPTTGGYWGGNATYNSGSSTYSKSSAGYGVKMNLKDDEPGARVVALEGYMYYNILRNSSVVPYYVNAYGNYSHLKTTEDTSYSYGLDFGGPSISWSGISSSSFDTITTHAQMAY